MNCGDIRRERSDDYGTKWCRRPRAKSLAGSRRTYAGFEGESSLLEELHNRGRALPVIGPDLHAGDGLLMFWTHGPVAPWQDDKWLAQMRRTLRPNQYLRMIENDS